MDRETLHEQLASTVREDVHAAIAELAGAPVRGLILGEDDPFGEPFPENPWGIGPDATLVGAIDHVWNLYDAPRLVNALLDRVMALVLFDGPRLGYLHAREDHHVIDRPPHDRRYAMSWRPFGDISLFTGAAPSEATTGKYCEVPEPLRTLYRCHAGLTDGLWRIAGPDDLMPWQYVLDETFPKWVETEDKAEQIRSDQLVEFFSKGDRSFVFDIRDPGAPEVRFWYLGHLRAGPGLELIDWLEDQTPLILSFDE